MDGSKSSLPYQILVYLYRWYLPLILVLQSLTLAFKTLTLPYPTGNIVSEVFLLVFFALIEYGRIESGERGNLTEKLSYVLASLVLQVPSCVVLVYWLLWQTYVLRVEVVVVVSAMVVQGLQLLVTGLVAVNVA